MTNYLFFLELYRCTTHVGASPMTHQLLNWLPTHRPNLAIVVYGILAE